MPLGFSKLVGTLILWLNSAYTNSNNALIIDVTYFSILQHRCDVIDFGQTLVYEMCIMRYLTDKTSILLQISRVFLMFRSLISIMVTTKHCCYGDCKSGSRTLEKNSEIFFIVLNQTRNRGRPSRHPMLKLKAASSDVRLQTENRSLENNIKISCQPFLKKKKKKPVKQPVTRGWWWGGGGGGGGG